MVDSVVTAATVHPRTQTIVYGCKDGSISKCWYGSDQQESKDLVLKKLIRVDQMSPASSSQVTTPASSCSALSSDRVQEKEEETRKKIVAAQIKPEFIKQS